MVLSLWTLRLKCAQSSKSNLIYLSLSQNNLIAISVCSIEAILKGAGATLKNVVDLTVFLVDMKHYAEFNQVYNEFFDAQTGILNIAMAIKFIKIYITYDVVGPSRTTVAVKELPSPKLLIEIKAVAYAG